MAILIPDSPASGSKIRSWIAIATNKLSSMQEKLMRAMLSHGHVVGCRSRVPIFRNAFDIGPKPATADKRFEACQIFNSCTIRGTRICVDRQQLSASQPLLPRKSLQLRAMQYLADGSGNLFTWGFLNMAIITEIERTLSDCQYFFRVEKPRDKQKTVSWGHSHDLRT